MRWRRKGSEASGPQVSRRTLVLGGVAALLAVITAWDYTRGSLGKGDVGRAVGAVAVSGVEPDAAGAAGGWREIAQLRHFRDHAELIRQRYASIAVPYAEMVAGLATLYAPGEAVREAAGRAIRGLLPAGVEVKDMLIAEAGSGQGDATWLNATLSLSSGDSQAMGRALVALGDPANGMVWKELSAGVDGERRRIQVRGQLAMLMLPLAE